MEIIKLKITEIKPYDKNPRKNDGAVDAVAESIKQCGYCAPIVIDEDNVILAGHTRLKALKKLKYKECECVRKVGMTEEQKRKYRLLDNKTNELAEWDIDLLKGELDGLDFLDFDFGFDIGIESEPQAIVEDEAPEVDTESEPITKLGDIWQLGEHRLMCGDSTDEKCVTALMDGKLAEMAFTDPPWNVNYGAIKEDNAQGYKPRTILNDFMGTEEFKNFMHKAFHCLNIASKDGAMTYVVMSAQEWGNMMLTLAMNDYHWSSTIIWNKDRLVLSRKDYHTKYEPIWYGWKDGSRLCPLKDRKQSDVWDIPRPQKSEEHPTMKPVELVARAITNSSKKGNIVLDLFGGSGTTLIASEQTGRQCRMMELDPKYCDVIVKRWETLTGKKAKKIKETEE